MFGADQWHLNGLDIDPAGENLYVVENHPGHLWRVAILADGDAGAVTEITTSRPLRGPDGLKVINATTLAVAEGSGMAIITLSGNTGQVRTVSTGFDGIATFALVGSNAWLVENQADHFWGAAARRVRPPTSRSDSSKRRSGSEPERGSQSACPRTRLRGPGTLVLLR